MNFRTKFIEDNLNMIKKSNHSLSYQDKTFVTLMAGKMANDTLNDVSHEDFNRLHVLATKHRSGFME